MYYISLRPICSLDRFRARDPGMSPRKYPYIYIIVEAFQFNGNGDDTRYHQNFLIPRSRVDRAHLPTFYLR